MKITDDRETEKNKNKKDRKKQVGTEATVKG